MIDQYRWYLKPKMFFRERKSFEVVDVLFLQKGRSLKLIWCGVWELRSAKSVLPYRRFRGHQASFSQSRPLWPYKRGYNRRTRHANLVSLKFTGLAKTSSILKREEGELRGSSTVNVTVVESKKLVGPSAS